MKKKQYKKQLERILQKYRDIHKVCCHSTFLIHNPHIKTLFIICSIKKLKEKYKIEMSKNINGCKFTFNRCPAVWVNINSSLDRRIVVLLHEIGHWLNDRSVIDSFPLKGYSTEEVKNGEMDREVWNIDVKKEEEAYKHSIKYIKSINKFTKIKLLKHIRKYLEKKSKEESIILYPNLTLPEYHCEACRNILVQFNEIVI